MLKYFFRIYFKAKGVRMRINNFNNSKNISGKKLKELRIQHKYTQKELAEKLQLMGIQISINEISKIENNYRLVQDFELFAFAEIFNVSADVFKCDSLINTI